MSDDNLDLHYNEIADDRLDMDEEEFLQRQKTCKRCGTPNLFWIETKQGWRLTDGNLKLHVCPELVLNKKTAL